MSSILSAPSFGMLALLYSPFHPTKEPLTEPPPPTFSTGEFWTACGILLGHIPKPGRLLDLANARPKHIRLQHLKYLQTRPMKEEWSWMIHALASWRDCCHISTMLSRLRCFDGHHPLQDLLIDCSGQAAPLLQFPALPMFLHSLSQCSEKERSERPRIVVGGRFNSYIISILQHWLMRCPLISPCCGQVKISSIHTKAISIPGGSRLWSLKKRTMSGCLAFSSDSLRTKVNLVWGSKRLPCPWATKKGELRAEMLWMCILVFLSFTVLSVHVYRLIYMYKNLYLYLYIRIRFIYGGFHKGGVPSFKFDCL